MSRRCLMYARCRRFLIWCCPMLLLGLLVLGGEWQPAAAQLANDEAPCLEAAAGLEAVGFLAFLAEATPAAPAKSCTTNAQCPKKNYCAKPVGECKGKGECTERPQACPDVFLPVCGCNGKTFSNDCWAAMDGVSVKAQGECPKAAKCKTNAQCGAGDFCAKADGKCEDEGICAKRPQLCPLPVDPVCGCNGKTFNNRCEAFRAGVDVKHAGKC